MIIMFKKVEAEKNEGEKEIGDNKLTGRNRTLAGEGDRVLVARVE